MRRGVRPRLGNKYQAGPLRAVFSEVAAEEGVVVVAAASPRQVDCATLPAISRVAWQYDSSVLAL
jgi:hypothetical protein